MKLVQNPDLRTSLDPNQTSGGELSPERRKELAAQFESLLVHELVKSMRATVQTGDKDFGVSMSMDMMDQSLSDAVAGRLGLGEHLLKQLDPSSKNTVALNKRVPARKSIVSPVSLGPSLGLPSLVPESNPAASSSAPQKESGIIRPVFGRSIAFDEAGPISPHGTELAADQQQEIYAVRKGTVIFAGSKKSYGQTVELKHDDGSVSRYTHATKIHVRVGDRIEAGECVADAAPGATNPQFEIHKFGVPPRTTQSKTTTP